MADDYGPAHPVEITNPDGVRVTLPGSSNDISGLIEPSTGQPVAANEVVVHFALADLAAAGIGHPRGEEDTSKKPWVVCFADAMGNTLTWKVAHAKPDHSLPLLTCTLTEFKQ